jgi:hypothetical protein
MNFNLALDIAVVVVLMIVVIFAVLVIDFTYQPAESIRRVIQVVDENTFICFIYDNKSISCHLMP